MALFIRILINAVAIWLAVWLLPGLDLVPDDQGLGTTVAVALVVSMVFGAVNAVVRPVVALLSLPLYILTLGLFTLVVNALMLMLTAWITELTDYGLRIDGFWWAVLGGFLVSVVSFLLSFYLVSAFERAQVDAEPAAHRS
jgi:putative membrane protein